MDHVKDLSFHSTLQEKDQKILGLDTKVKELNQIHDDTTLQNKITELTQEKEKLNKEKIKLQNDLYSVKKDLDEKNVKINDLDGKIKELTEGDDKLKALSDKLSQTETKMDELKKQNDAYATQINDTNTKLEALKHVIGEANVGDFVDRKDDWQRVVKLGQILEECMNKKEINRGK